MDYDWLVLECTALFEEQQGLKPLLSRYRLVTLKISPVTLGFPCMRLRKYMLLVRRGRLEWREEIERMGHHAAFRGLFARSIQTRGVDLARAPNEQVVNYKKLMCKQRGMPLQQQNGNEWSFFQCATGSVRNKVMEYEALASQTHPEMHPPLLCNARQHATFMTCTAMVPTLLRRSLLWSLSARRPLLPGEHLEVMGFNLFGPNPCRPAAALLALPEAQMKNVAGNGMHSAAVGCAILFLLSGVVVVPQSSEYVE